MTDNAITITLDDILGPDGMEGAYESMARRLAERVESKFLHSDGATFHATVVALINDAVHARIAAKIEATMSEPIQPTDGYGQPKGDPTTFQEMIGAAIESAMTVKADASGQRDNYGKTIMQRALEDVAGAELRLAVKKEMAAIREKAKQAVAREVAKAVAERIK